MEIKRGDVARIPVLVTGEGVGGIGVPMGERLWRLKRCVWEERYIVRHWRCEVGWTRSLTIKH